MEPFGLSGQAVRRRVRSGHWRRCAAGVYFVEDREFGDRARIRSAVWGFGDAACASGLAAAFWLGLASFAPGVVDVTVPRNSNGRNRDGCRLRRRDLFPDDVVEYRGLRTTSLPLTVIEAAVRREGGPGDRNKQNNLTLAGYVVLRFTWRDLTECPERVIAEVKSVIRV